MLTYCFESAYVARTLARCKRAQKHITGKVRIIEYTTSKTERAKIKAYCLAHNWDVYFPNTKELRGD